MKNVQTHTITLELTIRKLLRFIRRSTAFSICDTRKNIRNNSFSFSRFANNRAALPCVKKYKK